MTLKFVSSIVKMNRHSAIIAVVGGGYGYLNELLLISHEHTHLEVHQDVNAKEMAELIGKCSFALAPASSIGYELSAIGIPWLGGWYVDNPKKIYEYT